MDNCGIYLLDEEMNPARESDPGEVWVAGSNLAAGYVGGQAPEKFCDNPYASHPGRNFLNNSFAAGLVNYDYMTC